MTAEEFRRVLLSAVNGSHDALEVILKLYSPMINKHSYHHGELDEDLRQYLLLHIALTISKFTI